MGGGTDRGAGAGGGGAGGGGGEGVERQADRSRALQGVTRCAFSAVSAVPRTAVPRSIL